MDDLQVRADLILDNNVDRLFDMIRMTNSIYKDMIELYIPNYFDINCIFFEHNIASDDLANIGKLIMIVKHMKDNLVMSVFESVEVKLIGATNIEVIFELKPNCLSDRTAVTEVINQILSNQHLPKAR